MEKEKWVYHRYDVIFWSMFLLGILFFLLHVSDVRISPYSGGECLDFGSDWVTETGETIDFSTFRASLTPENDRIVLKKALPDSFGGSDLNFRSKNINFEISIENDTIFCFHPDLKNLVGKSYGSSFHMIHLDSSYAGKIITLTLFPIYADNSGFINLMQLGDSGAYYHEFMRGHMMPFLMCIAIIIFGTVMLLLSMASRGVGASGFNMRSLGALAIMLGVWSCMQTLVPQMLSGDVILIHGLNYLLLMILPYPAIRFSNSLMASPNQRYPRFGVVVTAVVTVGCAALNYLRILDFHESLPLVHMGLLSTVAVIAAMFIRNRRYCRENGIRRNEWLLPIAFLSFIVLCMIDLCRYAFSHDGTDDAGYFMRIGMFFFFAILFVRSFMLILGQMKLAGKAEAMRHLAYTDPLTGLPNRAAFLKKEEELKLMMDRGEIREGMVCQFDINNLKSVNDTYGHAYGDRHIKAGGEAINLAFGQTGGCYRVGGDEFVALLFAEPLDQRFRECCERLEEAEREYNARPDTLMPLRIAWGRARFGAANNVTMEEAKHEADLDMYATKRNMKREMEEQSAVSHEPPSGC